MFITKNNLQVNDKDLYPEIKFETSLFLFGNTGTGKTYKAKQLAKSLLNQFPSECGEYLTTNDLIQSFLDLFSDKVDAKEIAKSRIKDVKKSLVLILDDLGKEKITEFNQSKLFEVIDERVKNNLPTIYTSNIPLKELYEIYDSATARRIEDSCLSFELNKRIKPKIKKFKIITEKDVAEEVEIDQSQEAKEKRLSMILKGIEKTNPRLFQDIKEKKDTTYNKVLKRFLTLQ